MRVKAKKKTTKQSATRAQRVEIFCQAIMQTKSQSDAYRLAYPNCKKWKAATIHNKASKFAKLDEVVARLSELAGKQLERHGATVDRILEELSRIAFFNPKMLLDEDGKPLPLKDLPDKVAAALSITETEDGLAYEYKLTDKARANNLLGQWFRMWSESHIPTTPIVPAGPNLNFNVDVSNKSPEEARRVYLAFKDECAKA